MKVSAKYLGSVSLLVGAVLPLPMTSFAAENDEMASFGIEEIVISARKFEESLQDAPIAISAFTAQGLEDRGLNTVTEIGDFVPNVKFNSSIPVSASNATVALFIRGIGQNDYQLAADPGVGLYLDGVYISRNVGNVLDVLNVERIEVLRGPQGTLFGRNTIGGAVNVVSKKPDEELGGDIEMTTGRWNRVQTKFNLNVPISDGLYASAAGIYHKRDGYVKGTVDQAPDLGDTDQVGGRMALRWAPDDKDIEVNIALDGSRTREESAPNVLIAMNNAPSTFFGIWNAAYAGPGQVLTPALAQAPFQHAGTWDSILPQFDSFTDPRFEDRRYESASDVDIWGISGTLDWGLTDNLNFKSITSFRSVTGYWTRDSDHTVGSIVQTKSYWEQQQFSQELQLQGFALDNKLKWVAGAYYSDESGDHLDMVQILDAYFASGAIVGGESLAFFGQATYDITEKLSVTGGIRWTEDKKDFTTDQRIIEAGFLTGAPLNPDGSGLADGGPLMGPVGSMSGIKDTAWTPLLTLSYRWNESLMT